MNAKVIFFSSSGSTFISGTKKKRFITKFKSFRELWKGRWRENLCKKIKKLSSLLVTNILLFTFGFVNNSDTYVGFHSI